MNNVLQQVEWESCVVESFSDPALQSYVRRRWGIPNPMITYFASVPWMARAVIDLHPEYGLLMHLDQTVADLVVLAEVRRTRAVSATLPCGRYCGLKGCPGRAFSA